MLTYRPSLVRKKKRKVAIVISKTNLQNISKSPPLLAQCALECAMVLARFLPEHIIYYGLQSQIHRIICLVRAYKTGVVMVLIVHED